MFMSFFKKRIAPQKFSQNFLRRAATPGFTIIELIVVISIMVVVTTVVLYNYQNFNSTTLVTNYAYEVAFAVKEAQVYGLSVLGGGSSASFQRGYGVHFDSASLGGRPASFTLFADIPVAGSNSPVGNGFFDNNTESPPVKTYSFAGNYRVLSFCGFSSSNSSNCGTLANPNQSLDITFVRPNPDAIINMKNGNQLYQNLSKAEITIISPNGSTKKIVVYSTGQISIQ